ncbi:ADP-ribosylation factor family-domain-containing protein [Scheffersomyces amazonensis]|uniref:ADP-ribosylation factor family-domain-containing protein n=1 Tax=Scheffersomyces amazonensis TaxID=1078765 RepID=UPI00315D9F3E
MGLLSIIKKQKLKDNEIRVLVLGLDNSGKTTIVKNMMGEDINIISPTMGFQINTLVYGNHTLSIWDIGGQTTLRSFWGNYFDKTNVIVWVIDCISIERLQESYEELREKVILQDRLTGIYLCVVINKIDLMKDYDENQLQVLKHTVIDKLDLHNQVPQLDKWSVHLVSGKSGTGLNAVLDWIVTREDDTLTPNVVAESILLQLHNCETEANENLIEILGLIKPSRSSSSVSSISSIVRGLFTKNSKLLILLSNRVKSIKDGEIDIKEVYKSFVNEFILWLDIDVIKLFQKYAIIISNGSDDEINLNRVSFSKPIIHVNNYINFIIKSNSIIRNPFILDKLNSIKLNLIEIVESYNNSRDNSELNDISFNNIQLFGQRRNVQSVSSFFKINQIVERTLNENIILLDNNDNNNNNNNINNNNSSIELLLLNLSNSNTNSSRFNALAILSLNKNSRSLMYPPFRINELSIYWDQDMIILKPIDYLPSSGSNSKIILKFNSDLLLEKWCQKLLLIFPFRQNNSPISDTFLILPDQEPPKMNGLGIDYVSDSSIGKSITPKYESPKISKEFKEVYSPISFSSNESPISQLLKQSTSIPCVDDLIDLGQPPTINIRRKYSDSSISSALSSESNSSYHERSLQIINKTLSNTSSKSKFKPPIEGSESDNYVKEIKRSTLSQTSLDSVFHEVPKSSQAVIENIQLSPKLDIKESFNNSTSSLLEPFQPQSQPKTNKSASVPDLSLPSKNSEKLYQLSTGSAIDISNFGKSYTPAFLSSDNLNNNESSTSLSTEKTKKKSFFGLFKKNSKPKVSGFDMVNSKPDSKPEPKSEPKSDEVKSVPPPIPPLKNKKSLVIQTTIEEPIEEALHSSCSENSITKPSAIPLPFALPSSTSTYFFKPYANGSSVSVGNSHNDSQTNISVPEEDLRIPQELKDTINNDESIDFFITNNSPKAMIISKWKERYGKWEMLTTNEKTFAKIVVNYVLNKSWLMFFKEEFDDEYEEDIDKPILLLDLNNQTTFRKSALDLQISSINSITSDKMNIMIRFKNGSLSNQIVENIENVLGVLATKSKGNDSLRSSKSVLSDGTITSSIMDKPSASSTLTSINTIGSIPNNIKIHSHPESNAYKAQILDSDKTTAYAVLNNPENSKLIMLNSMTVRLQKQLETYSKISVPSSWKILSMYSLSVYLISDNFTNKNYYNLVLNNDENTESDEPYSFLIADDERHNKLERIGRAGLLVKLSDSEIYMIECRGKKELKQLYEKFAL